MSLLHKAFLWTHLYRVPIFNLEQATCKFLAGSVPAFADEAPRSSADLENLLPSATGATAWCARLPFQATLHSPYGVRWPHWHPSGYQPLSSPIVNHPTQVANDMIVTRLAWKQYFHEHLATKRSSKHCIIKAELLVGVRLVISDLEATPTHYS